VGKNRRKKLDRQIEKTFYDSNDPQLDHHDHNIIDHVKGFLSMPLPQLAPFSIMSQEEAKKALTIIETSQAELERRIRIARALKNLCLEEQRRERDINEDI
jgi:hypothetical protein